MASSSREQDPIWIVKDPGSFSSIVVKLPPGTTVNCESDAVVAFSQGVQVRGVMAGGILSSLARTFLTNESFFTTIVENTDLESVAEVMIAPKDPGGIVLHKMTYRGTGLGRERGDGDGDDLLLTSGAYIASDSNIKVTSKVQSIGKSLFSQTGSFLLRASSLNEGRGVGYVAFGAYGSVHKYVLGVGEIQSVDNGHLVAWSESMKYWVGLASLLDSRSSTSSRIMNSMTSGEGLMCHFEGPGTVYIQSHKPDPMQINSSSKSKGGGNQPLRLVGVFIIFIIIITLYLFPIIVYNMRGGNMFEESWHQQSDNERYYDRRQREL